MKARLVSVDVVPLIDQISLEVLPVVIGRNPEAGVCICDTWASRCHCQIAEVAGTLRVRDLGSRNGTLVNGRQVHESPLLPGDRVTIGISTFRAEYETTGSEERCFAKVELSKC